MFLGSVRCKASSIIQVYSDDLSDSANVHEVHILRTWASDSSEPP